MPTLQDIRTMRALVEAIGGATGPIDRIKPARVQARQVTFTEGFTFVALVEVKLPGHQPMTVEYRRHVVRRGQPSFEQSFEQTYAGTFAPVSEAIEAMFEAFPLDAVEYGLVTLKAIDAAGMAAVQRFVAVYGIGRTSKH